jgi:PAS domain S-box-containing protein
MEIEAMQRAARAGSALQHRVTLAFAAALAVVLVLALAVFNTASRALDAGAQVAHTEQVLELLDGVEAAAVRAESATRGFVITGDAAYLADRDLAVSTLESRTQSLRDLTADNPSQQERWRLLRERLDERLALLDRLVVVRQTKGAGAARKFILTAPPLDVMRGLRNTLADMSREEQQLLARRTQQEERRRGVAVAAGLGLTAVFVLLFSLGYLAIRRQVAETLDARQRVEAEAASSEALLESAPDGVVIIDAVGRIALVNAQTERLFGYARDELIGRSIETLVPERVRERHIAHRDSYLGAPRIREMGVGLELHGRRRDGSEFPVEISLSPIRTAEGPLVFSNVRDATERKDAEKKLRELNASLMLRTEEVETANRELEGFSYSVSHDLRAPLRAIDGFSRMIAEDYGGRLDDEGRRRLGVIRANSRKMAQLIDDLLDFSRLGKKQLAHTAVDMTALAGDAYRELRAAAPVGSPVLDLTPLPAGWGDAAMLRQVFANLLSNALKYVHKDRAAHIEVKGSVDGDKNVYYVKDNGVGFDMAYYEKLFGVFQRLHTESEFPGTGVGLAIVQRVVTRHGGSVWAEAKLNEGASFYFSLPNAEGADATRAAAEEKT